MSSGSREHDADRQGNEKDLLRKVAELEAAFGEVEELPDVPALAGVPLIHLEGLLDAGEGDPEADRTGPRLEIALQLAVGDRVGSVVLRQLLGRGGMGEVWRGDDQKLGRSVAVKSLLRDPSFDGSARERFRREARVLSRLNHSSICQVYDLVEGERADYLLLELVEGETLRDWISPGRPLAERLEVAVKIADALSVAHGAGIVHRDLKPENVMVTGNHEIKILDFGIARLAREGGDFERAGLDSRGPTTSLEELATFRTRTGSVVGTPAYMSPEQARGAPIGSATDVWALGVLFHELFANVRPKALDNPWVTLASDGEIDLSPGLPAVFRPLLARMLERDPVARPSVSEVAARLRWVAGRRSRRIRRAMASAAVVAVAVGAGFALHARWKGRRQAALAQELGAEQGQLEWRLRAEHLAAPHDVAPVVEEIELSMRAMERRIDELGSFAIGPGRAALGRAAYVLDRFEDAREHYRTAWEAGYRPQEVVRGYGMVLARLYQDAALRARRTLEPRARATELARLREELGDPARDLLARVQPDADDVEAPLLVAWLAVAEDRIDDALTGLSAAAPPWFPDAALLAVELQIEEADPAIASGRLDEGLVDLRRAEEILTPLLTQVRSHPMVWNRACRTTYLQIFAITKGSSEPLEEHLETLRRRCARAQELNSKDAYGSIALSAGLRSAAQVVANSDFAAAVDLAEESLATARKAIEIQPDRSRIRQGFVMALTFSAQVARFRNLDPNPSLQEAWEAFRPSLEGEEPELRDLDAGISLAARTAELGGSDPALVRKAIEEGLELVDRRLSMEWRTIAAANGANLHYLAGTIASSEGRSPEPSFQAGIALLERTLEAAPDEVSALRILLRISADRLAWRVLVGEPTDDLIDDAREAASRLLGRVENGESLLLAALVEMRWAEDLQARGRSAARPLETAAELLERIPDEGLYRPWVEYLEAMRALRLARPSEGDRAPLGEAYFREIATTLERLGGEREVAAEALGERVEVALVRAQRGDASGLEGALSRLAALREAGAPANYADVLEARVRVAIAESVPRGTADGAERIREARAILAEALERCPDLGRRVARLGRRLDALED